MTSGMYSKESSANEASEQHWATVLPQTAPQPGASPAIRKYCCPCPVPPKFSFTSHKGASLCWLRLGWLNQVYVRTLDGALGWRPSRKTRLEKCRGSTQGMNFPRGEFPGGLCTSREGIDGSPASQAATSGKRESSCSSPGSPPMWRTHGARSNNRGSRYPYSLGRISSLPKRTRMT